MHRLVPSEAIAGLLSDADEQEIRLHHQDQQDRRIQFDAVLREIAAETGEDARTLVPSDAGSLLDGGRGWGAPDAPGPALAAVGGDFDAYGGDLAPFIRGRVGGRHAAPVAPPRTRGPVRSAPRLSTSAGDLVCVFGLRSDALRMATAMAMGLPSVEVAIAGDLADASRRRVSDRREALQARADGVRSGGSTLVAVGLGEAPGDAHAHADLLDTIEPDQLWIAVDATRKVEDTRLWAQVIAEAGHGIDAVALFDTALTSTPDAVMLLGLPVGWSDAY